MIDAILYFLWDHLEHVLAVLLLISRIGDIGTTFLVTPSLRLEANPIMRKLGWPFAVATLLLCLVPYFNLTAAVMILMPFLMISAGNAGRIWIARALGEGEYHALLIRAARRSRPIEAILPICVSAGFIMLTGLVVLLFYPRPSTDWGFWIGVGIILYGVAIAFYGTLSVRRLFRQASLAPA